MSQIKLNFAKIEVKDVEGKVLTDLSIAKDVGNAVYFSCADISLLDIARKIHEGVEVEVSLAQVTEIYKILNLPYGRGGLAAFARKPVIDYLTPLIEAASTKKA